MDSKKNFLMRYAGKKEPHQLQNLNSLIRACADHIQNKGYCRLCHSPKYGTFFNQKEDISLCLYKNINMLWVLIRSASLRCFWWVPTAYVFMEKWEKYLPDILSTVFNLITARAPISTQSSDFILLYKSMLWVLIWIASTSWGNSNEYPQHMFL